jgi:transglutaminase-like putative cysteine protease
MLRSMSGTEDGAFLEPTPIIDWDQPDVAAYARRCAGGAASDVEVAVQLYYAVRDDIRYDPYGTDVSVEGLRASGTLAVGRGWCVAKAILLAACCRCLGVRARLGFADVRNHMATARLRERMKTDVFYWHGYTSIHLGGRWIKATPAFNIELCQKFGLPPLEFDGRKDSIYQPFDPEGKRFMEYLQFRGEYADVPIDEIIATFREAYPALVEARMAGDFHREAEEENPTG